MISPLVTVIVPCYNQSSFLTETLNSVQAQTYSRWECIIINDGSTDNTEEVAKSFCEKDKRFRYLFKTNGGLSSARNAGLREAKGGFVQFLDSDDIILPDKFEKHVTSLDYNVNTDIIVSGYRLFKTDPTLPFDTPISLKPYDCSLTGFLYSWNLTFVFPPVCYFVKRDFLVKNQIFFNENTKALEDWIFLVQLSLSHAIFYIDKSILALYRRHAVNMTNNIDFMSRYFVKASFLVYETLPEELKLEFIDSIDKFLITNLKGIFNIDQLEKKANSSEYKVGSAILLPFQLFRNFLIKGIKKLKKIL